MPKEIERRFLVDQSVFLKFLEESKTRPVTVTQGYLCTGDNTIRVRLVDSFSIGRFPQSLIEAFITIKSKRVGFSADEYEYPIPQRHANEMLSNMCKNGIVSKQRYSTFHDGFEWDVDVFLGENAGLVIAEIELSEESTEFNKPAWVTEEISSDHRYSNANLSAEPFTLWGRRR
jgi:CYTH domain-containing protein